MRDFFGERLRDAEASELCDEVPPAIEPDGGCDWDGTVEALSGAYDVLLVADGSDTRDEAWEKLKQCVGIKGVPVVAHLLWGFSGGKHAVVVCRIVDDRAEFINPATGRVDDLSREEFLGRWQLLDFGAFYFTE